MNYRSEKFRDILAALQVYFEKFRSMLAAIQASSEKFRGILAVLQVSSEKFRSALITQKAIITIRHYPLYCLNFG